MPERLLLCKGRKRRCGVRTPPREELEIGIVVHLPRGHDCVERESRESSLDRQIRRVDEARLGSAIRRHVFFKVNYIDRAVLSTAVRANARACFCALLLRFSQNVMLRGIIQSCFVSVNQTYHLLLPCPHVVAKAAAVVRARGAGRDGHGGLLHARIGRRRRGLPAVRAGMLGQHCRGFARGVRRGWCRRSRSCRERA